MVETLLRLLIYLCVYWGDRVEGRVTRINRRERALTALEMREPDMVPIMEIKIDPPHIDKIIGGELMSLASPSGVVGGTVSKRKRIERGTAEALVACYDKLGLDLVPTWLGAPEGWESEALPDGSFVDEWGRVIVYDPRCRVWIQQRGSIKTPEDFENRPFPDPHAPGRLEPVEYQIRLVKGEMAVAARVRAPFAIAFESFDIRSFYRLVRENPHFIKKVIERLTDFNVEAIKILVDAGVDLIISGGDLAEKNGPLFSPKYFKELIFPSMKREVDAANKRGVKFIKHSDGNINPLLDDLASIVDGLHSLDPSASMDIGTVKQKYGDRLVLMGNVAVDTLALGSRKNVVEETKECIRRVAPGGGYFLSSSNSWYANAKLENCLAMVEAGRKYGRYPISFNSFSSSLV